MLQFFFPLSHALKFASAVMIILACTKQEEIPMTQTLHHKIKVTLGGKEFTATLNDSKTSRDFISLFPLELTLEDYAGTEKIDNLPRRLSTEGAPDGSTPSVGDIAFYAPWGNLAVFYKDFRYSTGLIIFGKMDSGIEQLSGLGRVNAKFELNAE